MKKKSISLSIGNGNVNNLTSNNEHNGFKKGNAERQDGVNYKDDAKR